MSIFSASPSSSYPELVGRIENHAKEAGGRMPAALAQVLDDHRPLVRSEREATKLADRLDACMKKRDELLERAGDRLSYGQPVTELGRPHGRWRREAGAALKAGRELIGNERHAVHLDALGGRSPVERAPGEPSSSTRDRHDAGRRHRPRSGSRGRTPCAHGRGPG